MARSDVQATAAITASTSAKVQGGKAHGVSVRCRLMRRSSRKEGGAKELVSILRTLWSIMFAGAPRVGDCGQRYVVVLEHDHSVNSGSGLRSWQRPSCSTDRPTGTDRGVDHPTFGYSARTVDVQRARRHALRLCIAEGRLRRCQ